jgi:hypothetical protein
MSSEEPREAAGGAPDVRQVGGPHQIVQVQIDGCFFLRIRMKRTFEEILLDHLLHVVAGSGLM